MGIQSMTKIELAQKIYQKTNPDTFGIDPLIIATIISIIIQIIRLIYDYNHPKQLYDDIQNPGIIRSMWLRYRIGLILWQQGYNKGCAEFINGLRDSLKGVNEQQLSQLMKECQ